MWGDPDWLACSFCWDTEGSPRARRAEPTEGPPGAGRTPRASPHGGGSLSLSVSWSRSFARSYLVLASQFLTHVLCSKSLMLFEIS